MCFLLKLSSELRLLFFGHSIILGLLLHGVDYQGIEFPSVMSITSKQRRQKHCAEKEIDPNYQVSIACFVVYLHHPKIHPNNQT